MARRGHCAVRACRGVAPGPLGTLVIPSRGVGAHAGAVASAYAPHVGCGQGAGGGRRGCGAACGLPGGVTHGPPGLCPACMRRRGCPRGAPGAGYPAYGVGFCPRAAPAASAPPPPSWRGRWRAARGGGGCVTSQGGTHRPRRGQALGPGPGPPLGHPRPHFRVMGALRAPLPQGKRHSRCGASPQALRPPGTRAGAGKCTSAHPAVE